MANDDEMGDISEFPQIDSYGRHSHIISYIRNLFASISTVDEVDDAFDKIEQEYPDTEFKRDDWRNEADVEAWADKMRADGFTVIDDPMCEGSDMIGYIAIPNEYFE